MLRRLFRLFDSDGGGTIDPQEFYTHLARLMAVKGGAAERLELLFRAYDDDESGALEGNELQNLVTQWELLARGRVADLPAELARLRAALDPATSGAVDWPTFRDCANSTPLVANILLHPSIFAFEQKLTASFAALTRVQLSAGTQALFGLLYSGATAEQVLVAAGAPGVDLEAVDEAGNTPLHYSVTTARPDLARILLEAGANPVPFPLCLFSCSHFHCAVVIGVSQPNL